MRTIEAKCPKCHVANQLGEDLIGRYALCSQCQCRFYVEVPPLADAIQIGTVAGPKIASYALESTTLNDPLRETQQGSTLVIEVLQKQQRLLTLLMQAVALLVVLTAVDLFVSVLAMVR